MEKIFSYLIDKYSGVGKNFIDAFLIFLFGWYKDFNTFYCQDDESFTY